MCLLFVTATSHSVHRLPYASYGIREEDIALLSFIYSKKSLQMSAVRAASQLPEIHIQARVFLLFTFFAFFSVFLFAMQSLTREVSTSFLPSRVGVSVRLKVPSNPPAANVVTPMIRSELSFSTH